MFTETILILTFAIFVIALLAYVKKTYGEITKKTLIKELKIIGIALVVWLPIQVLIAELWPRRFFHWSSNWHVNFSGCS
ncbi:hypothetical protein [Thermococcus sp.]